MEDIGTNEFPARGFGGGFGIERFASEVVSVLASRGARQEQEPRETLLAGLVSGVVSADPAALAQCLEDMRRSRITANSLADIYIPRAAQRMGRAWEDDSMGFTEVTVGTARLQYVMREISALWAADNEHAGSQATVLMIVPEGENHTLGAVTATGQLRRAGVSVAVKLNTPVAELAEYVASRSFDAIMISSSCPERLENPDRIVNTLKAASLGRVPVVVGGSILACDRDVRALTGADVVTNQVDEAIRQCGLKIKIKGAARRA